jgi:hypothetical protein
MVCKAISRRQHEPHAVEKNKPFLSETAYRSFLGVGGVLCPGYTPDQFATGIVGAFVERELKGKLCKIVPLRRRAGDWAPSASRN